MSVVRVVRAFVRKPADERRLLVTALALHMGVVPAIRLLPYAWVGRGLRRVARFRTGRTRPAAASHAVSEAVRKTACLVPGRTCLSDALVGQCLLWRLGHQTALRIGVHASDEHAGRRFAAHAWLECDGATMIGASRVPYAPLVHADLES